MTDTRQEPSPVDDLFDLPDLAAERFGAAVVYANDEFFAEKDNLVKPGKAVFLEGKYTDRGKWMDGWETRRRRPFDPDAEDFCLIRLGLAGVVKALDIQTTHFKGNYPESAAVDGCAVIGHVSPEELLSPTTRWLPLLPRTALSGDSSNRFVVTAQSLRLTHLRLRIFPDGGVARLRVHGQVMPSARSLALPEQDLASVEAGGQVLCCSDMFFGNRHNLLLPGRPLNMGDGWETRRSRRPGPEWALVQLGARATVVRIEVDTTHFRGNAPESCEIAVFDQGLHKAAPRFPFDGFRTILNRTALLPHTRHLFEAELAQAGPLTHVLLRTYPDGGVARLRVYGHATDDAVLDHGVRLLSLRDRAEVEADLLRCCGARAWASQMLARLPLSTMAELLQAARAIWASLDNKDCMEAFFAHPRIGETRGLSAWSKEEQRGAASAESAIQAEIRAVNQAYEARFGYLYLVCATGKSAEELLTIAKERLNNSPDHELTVAKEEQRKIMELRLSKLVRR